jgi:hypothetical protein
VTEFRIDVVVFYSCLHVVNMKIKSLSSLLAASALASGTLLVSILPAAAGGKFVGNCSNVFIHPQPPKVEKHPVQAFYPEPKHPVKAFYPEPKHTVQAFYPEPKIEIKFVQPQIKASMVRFAPTHGHKKFHYHW